MENLLKSICFNKTLFNRDLNHLIQCIFWSGYPNYINEKYFKITIKQKLIILLNSGFDVFKTIYFGF